jgi:hypothetical protein
MGSARSLQLRTGLLLHNESHRQENRSLSLSLNSSLRPEMENCELATHSPIF